MLISCFLHSRLSLAANTWCIVDVAAAIVVAVVAAGVIIVVAAGVLASAVADVVVAVCVFGVHVFHA